MLPLATPGAQPMAIPRVFVSSTCYDLKYIREELKHFIRTIGYEPVLSDEGDVFYNPGTHTHDACLAEVPTCQLFVLIIGGRYGGKFKESDDSITNREYKKAVEMKVPIFTLVEQPVYAEHHVYVRNKQKKDVIDKITFPAVDNVRIFDFIDEVRQQVINNALVPFGDFGDIESYLRKQFAGMMFDFLRGKNEFDRVADTLQELKSMNEKIEMLSAQILKQTAKPNDAQGSLRLITIENELQRVVNRLTVSPFLSDFPEIADVAIVVEQPSLARALAVAGYTVSMPNSRSDYVRIRHRHLKDVSRREHGFADDLWNRMSISYNELHNEALVYLKGVGETAESFLEKRKELAEFQAPKTLRRSRRGVTRKS